MGRSWERCMIPKAIRELDRVDVSPAEIVFSDENEIVNLTAVAHWKDGTSEDVTELCRFSSNNDAIADIDETGRIKSGDRGDTHVVVYYDKAVIPVPVLRPVGISTPSKSKAAESKHSIDRLVQQKLDKLGIIPSGVHARILSSSGEHLWISQEYSLMPTRSSRIPG